ncbi:glutamate racemase [Deinococcus radiomollis]|uniref:glutamate racemase n=1 Tax=Deinococcus radiomollis TaxID=468916 RepID=UPI003892116A
MTGDEAAGNRPIGVFDSGVGGLSVLAHLKRLLPHETFVYFADTAHCPYGERSPEEIGRLTLRAVRWLEAQGCKLLVIACNTACAFSLQSVRAAAQVPVVGLVPALKPAVEGTRSGVVAVFATPVTLEGSLLRDVTEKYAVPAGVSVLKVWQRDLVPLVEAGQADSRYTRELLRGLLTPTLAAGADALVLGCTHYPFLIPALKAEFGDAFTLHDSGAGVAKRTRALLAQAGLLTTQERSAPTQLHATGDMSIIQTVAAHLYADALEVHALRLPEEGLSTSSQVSA